MEVSRGSPIFFRLSPAADKAQCFAVWQGEIRERADVNYSYTSQLVSKLYSKPSFPLVRLGECVRYLQYGISSLATNEPIGVPILRMNNLQDDGWDFSNLKYIQLPTKDLETYRLVPGDILFNRTNSKELVGKCEVFRQEGDWVFASYLIRMSVDESKALPDFVAGFLNTHAGRTQIDRLSRQIIGMSNINAEEIKTLHIPLPPLHIQRRLVRDLEIAREAKKLKLNHANALLGGLDNYLQVQLGLSIPPEEKPSTFAVKLGQIQNRIDVFFYTPFLSKTEDAVLAFKPKVVPLSSLLQSPPVNGLDARKYSETGRRYLRVQNIKPFELILDDIKFVLVESEKDISLKAEDILLTRKGTFGVATLVPKNAEDCLISSEIILLRLAQDADCLPHYLVAWLNSSVAKTLLNRRKSGGIMGHLTQDVVSDFPVPIPPLEVQQRIVYEIGKRRDEIKRLKVESAVNWEEAKTLFEQKLLGEAYTYDRATPLPN